MIQLKKNKFKTIVREAIEKVLTSGIGPDDVIDITKIPIDILKQGYFDYRLAPVTSYYGNVLHEPVTVKEAVNDIFPADDAIKNIITKYNLPPQFAVKVEHYHKIYVYAITALIGHNDTLIESDMNKMGYFLSKRGDVIDVQGMKFQILQFEPLSQLQEDITEQIKTDFDTLYHWTPLYNVAKILSDGLIPYSKNSVFRYPPRIYLMEGNSTDQQRLYFGRILCASNTNPNNTGQYALLSIDLQNLDESIRFYYDPNSEIGIYTEQPIPNDKIKVSEIVQLKKPK